MIDVGYAGVIGADRILDGQAPYGHMPVEDGLRACGPADADGEIRERIQSNGRCESANPRGDTYGPVAYLAYVPAVARVRLDRAVGLAARGARDGDRLRPARARRARPRRAALRRHAARGRARLRLGRVPVHEPTRCSRTRTTRSCPRCSSGASGSRRRRPRGAPPSRSPAGRSSPRSLLAPLWLTYPRRPPAATPGAVRARVRASRRCSPSRSCCSSRPSRTRCARSGTGRSGSSSTASRRSRSGTGASTTPAGSPTSRSLQTVVQVGVVVLAGGRRGRPAREGPARARGADRRAPARVRALADALVLPLPSLGAALRPARPVPARRGRAADDAVSAEATAGRRAPRPRSSSASPRSTATVLWQRDRGRGHRHPALPHLRRADRGRRSCPYRDFGVEYPPGALPGARPPGARDRRRTTRVSGSCFARRDGARRRGRRAARRGRSLRRLGRRDDDRRVALAAVALLAAPARRRSS